MKKQSRRFDFLSSIDYFGGIFISIHSMCFNLKLEDHSMTLFTGNQIRFVHNFNYRWKISVCAKCCFSLIETGKRIHFYEFPVDLFARNQFFLTLEKGNKSIFSIKIIFCKTLIFRAIRIREKLKSN